MRRTLIPVAVALERSSRPRGHPTRHAKKTGTSVYPEHPKRLKHGEAIHWGLPKRYCGRVAQGPAGIATDVMLRDQDRGENQRKVKECSKKGVRLQCCVVLWVTALHVLC